MNRTPDPEHAKPYPYEAILADIQNRSRRRLDRFNLIAALLFIIALFIWGLL